MMNDQNPCFVLCAGGLNDCWDSSQVLMASWPLHADLADPQKEHGVLRASWPLHADLADPQKEHGCPDGIMTFTCWPGRPSEGTWCPEGTMTFTCWPLAGPWKYKVKMLESCYLTGLGLRSTLCKCLDPRIWAWGSGIFPHHFSASADCKHTQTRYNITTFHSVAVETTIHQVQNFALPQHCSNIISFGSSRTNNT